jgi:hypothetical protein
MTSTRPPEPATRHEQLRQGWALLARGHFQDAGWAFGRILREEPDHHEARRGREQAQGKLAEARRQADLCLAEAEAARASGDDSGARRLAEQALASGADADEALGLLDRLPAVPGAIADPLRRDDAHSGAPPPDRAHGLVWSRVGLVSFWVVAFALIATGVASSWEQIVDRLASAPRQEAGR